MAETQLFVEVELVASGEIDDGDFVTGDDEDFKVYQVVGLDVIELTEEAEEFDDENDRWLRLFSTPREV